MVPCSQYLFGSQIPMTTGRLPSGLGNCFVCKRFVVQTLLWSLEFMIQINLEYDIYTSSLNNEKKIIQLNNDYYESDTV